MRILQIRNATLKIEYDGTLFLIDPWLSDKNQGRIVTTSDSEKNKLAGPLTDLPLSRDEIMQDVDICLLTHLHFDHFTPEKIPQNMRILFQNKYDHEVGYEYGFNRAEYFKTDTIKINHCVIRRVDGLHGDKTAVSDRMGKVSGYVFTSPNEKTLYLAGDTVYYEGVEQAITDFCPDIIIVNGCDAQIPDGRLIMNEDDIIKVCRYAPESTVIVSHMDQVNHGFLTRAGLRKILHNTSYEKQVLIPEDGEELII